MLGLPPDVKACLFDMDGVLTSTATLHAAAWKQTFDEFLRQRSEETGEPFVPFDQQDYLRYVDGRARALGTRTFLDSRGIELPEGSPDDPPAATTVNGLSNRKNELVLAKIADGKVQVYEGSVRYLEAVRAAGLPTAVVSASANTAQVLDVAGIAHLFDARIDGIVALERGLSGKPAPDTFLAGAEAVGATAATSVVFEDALAGVEAGRAGNFAFVVGVDRVGQADALREHGADIVVSDLSELLTPTEEDSQP